MRDSASDWRAFDSESIPTKTHIPHLLAFVASSAPDPGSIRVLDLGCGQGKITEEISELGVFALGVDINRQAIEDARTRAGANPRVRFVSRDIASPSGLDLSESDFDLVVCQLVISVIGGSNERHQLLTNAREALKPAGRLYLSASGVSGSINENYAQLYDRDFELTGERHTYLSRNAAGQPLYATHHFENEELERLLVDCGFDSVSLTRRKEVSSRRVGEAAYFLYAMARNPD